MKRTRIIYANTWCARFWGWHRRQQHDAVWLTPCGCVHTFAMRIPLRLFWLDASGCLIREDAWVAPNRVRFCWGAHSVIETAAEAKPQLWKNIRHAFSRKSRVTFYM